MWLFYKNKSTTKPNLSDTKKEEESSKSSIPTVIEHDWDDAIDLIANINFKHVVEGDKLHGILFSDTYSQKINIHGMNSAKQHCKLDAKSNYHGLFFSIPLASRHNSISGMEFSHFLQYIQRIAIFLEGDLDVPSMQDILTKSQNLKDLAINASQYLQFKILLKEPTQTNKLIEWFYAEGKYQAISSNQCGFYLDNKHIYTIEWPQQEFTQVLYFYYTPSLVEPNVNGLKVMCDDMDLLLQSWSAIVCTPDNQVLSYEMYEQISKNIQTLEASLEVHGLKAGGASIKRLLSYKQ
jgi:hypothetical protein